MLQYSLIHVVSSPFAAQPILLCLGYFSAALLGFLLQLSACYIDNPKIVDSPI